MAIALAREKLSLNDTQIHELSTQIRHGDLTPVLRIYEEDIKSPVRKALTGSLIRSLLIQIQKAKVDLDQALSGIDKLLKSQELTFAFVGVAPSLAIVYTAFNGARTLWEGRRGNKRLGGRRDVLCSESMRDSVEAAFESLRKRYHFVQFMDRSWKI